MSNSVRAMSFVVDQGKAFYWGTSEWSAQEIMEAHMVARREHLIPPLMEQPQYSMLHRERVEIEYAPLYERFGLGTTIWSPLASGLLSGKYNDGKIPPGTRSTLEGYEWLRSRVGGDAVAEKIEQVRRLSTISDELGCTMAQLALAWCLRNPHVSTVISGASKASQVTENMAALDIVGKLTAEVMARVEAILDNKPELEPDYR